MAKAIFKKQVMPGGRIFTILACIWTICLFLPVRSQAGDNPAKDKIPESLYPGLHHFLELVDPDKNVSFDPGMVAPVLEFVEGPKDKGTLYHADGISAMPSAYYEFDIRKNLTDVAAYSFNPDIPDIATMPSSARLFLWLDEKGQESFSPRVGQYLDNSDIPVIIKGLCFVENTPDINSGAYYAYNLYQTLVIFKYRRRNILITISRQTDVSTVGKKGYVLGADNDWDYFYSGKRGLTLPALGWIRSYMYDSRTVAIYDETDRNKPSVRCAMFKWLRAGWSGINMVRNEHIYNGIKRFAKPFKEILESPLLPPLQTLTSDFKRIRGLSENTLRSKMKIYSNILKNRYNSGNPRSKNLPSKLFDNTRHWQRMSKEEMQSALVVEYMKAVMGKTDADETGELLESSVKHLPAFRTPRLF